jgi:hypothetical protein
MNETTVEPAMHLRRQMLEWITERPRGYADVLEVWRTSCPRLSIWEDACIDGLVDCAPDRDHTVSLTAKGMAFLHERGGGV